MRESIGGSWLFGIVAVFISLFTAFLAYSISYTRAFNAKNNIISIIEESEGYTKSEQTGLENMTLEQLNSIPEDEKTAEDRILASLKSTGYNYSSPAGIDCREFGHLANNLLTANGEKYLPTKGGYCITKMCPDGSDSYQVDSTGRWKGRTYYKVTTFIAIKIPILNFTAKIPISGETETMYYDVTKASNCPLDN